MKVGDINVEETIFGVTSEFLIKYGVKGWNMDDLAKESNMSKRTLYKIIGNKEDLIVKCISGGLKDNINLITNFLSSSKPFPKLLEQFIDIITDNFQEYVLKSITAIRIEYPKIKVEEERFLAKRQQLLLLFFNKGKKEGYLHQYANPETIIKIVYALVDHNISTCDNKTDFKNETSETLGLFFKGLLK